MARTAEEPQRDHHSGSSLRRAVRGLVLGITLLFVLLALVVSSTLVVYTAWIHDLRNGVFALVFAVLSAQIALNWLLWKDDSDDPEEGFF